MAIIMSSGRGDEMIAAEAIKLGAKDYIPKTQLTPEAVKRIFQNAVEKTRLQRKVTEQREELENFANVLVHDLKSPTFSIQSFAGFIQQAIAEGNTKAAIKHCQRVIEIAERMEQLVETLHQYTLAEAKVAFAPVSMHLVIKDTLSNLENAIGRRGARVTNDALPSVIGNASLLIQLMQNLIGNSIKYCVAETPIVHISSNSYDGAKWLFSIKDNGIGIPEADCRTVFEPFKRLRGASEYAGTGLGLATCRKIVERHGGEIWCQSIVEKETTFFFTLSKA
jgi:light-regulated signal transduction histidine kinase (bacteriophytochrome)